MASRRTRRVRPGMVIMVLDGSMEAQRGASPRAVSRLLERNSPGYGRIDGSIWRVQHSGQEGGGEDEEEVEVVGAQATQAVHALPWMQ